MDCFKNSSQENPMELNCTTDRASTDNMSTTAMDTNTTPTTALAEQVYWELVYADSQYTLSKALGKYGLAVIFLIGGVGNLLSFTVMVRKRMKGSSTALYMAVLALADTAVLLFGCLRRWVVEMWTIDLLNASEAACQIINFLQYWSFDFAVWILVAMTIDRVIVVSTPLKAHIYATRCRATVVIAFIAVSCAGINCHFFFTSHITQGVCTANSNYLDFYKTVWPWVDATVYSFTPFTFLLILNTLILIFMTKANRRKRRLATHFKRKVQDEQRFTIRPSKLTIMLLSITIAFVVLSAPAVVLHIMRELGSQFFNLESPQQMARYILIRQISRILLYLNHSINFFLYCVAGSKFRSELHRMFGCRRHVRESNLNNTIQCSMRSVYSMESNCGNSVTTQVMRD